MKIECPDCLITRDVKFVRKGRFRCLSCARRKMFGENNPSWKKNPKYIGLHVYVRKYKPCNGKCQICSKKIDKKNLDLAKLNGRKYTRNQNNYIWLCKSCHNIYDNKHENFKNVSNVKNYKITFYGGVSVVIRNLQEFCLLNGFNQSSIQNLIRKKTKNHGNIVAAEKVI